MNDSNAFERHVAAEFAREGRGPAATDDVIRELVTRARQAGQRPRLLAIVKEPPMRHASRVVVGSPTARVVAVTAATLLIALLATGALVVGGQSPSPAPPEGQAAPQAPVAFTGVWCIGPPIAPDRNGTFSRIDVGDGQSLDRNRGGAWRNGVLMSDPRLQGDAYQTYESDDYLTQGSATGPSIIASTLSIVNEDGAWVSTLYRATVDGADLGDAGTQVFVGQGAYEGLVAVVSGEEQAVPRPEGLSPDFSGCTEYHGAILEGAPVPEPILAQ
jgi:hypothetical protein